LITHFMILAVDKIASITKNLKLKNILDVGTKIKCEDGAVIVGEVLVEKRIYNQLELPSGRFAALHKGDIIVVALGNRRALKGFVGDVPTKLKVGDIIQVLNLGGVAGICTSENYHQVGHALKIRVLGSVTDKNNEPESIKRVTLFKPATKIMTDVPIIVVSGTCMEVGKTTTACEIINSIFHKGMLVCAAKVAGVAAMKDTLAMEDYGAYKSVSIIDAGFTSTASSPKGSLEITKGAINYLSKENPDYIVVELGDGVFGEYGVQEILADEDFEKHIWGHVGCAHDPMGAVKLAETCQKLGAPLDLIAGPVSDNSVGVNFIEQHLKIGAFNSLSNGDKLFPYLLKNAKKKR